MLGGNASSEIRMWVSGAGSRVRHLQETGLVEEILLENMYRNPTKSYAIFDTVLYELVRNEKNITMLGFIRRNGGNIYHVGEVAIF